MDYPRLEPDSSDTTYGRPESPQKQAGNHVLDPQDKAAWCKVGNERERAFVAAHGAVLGLTINPEKAIDIYVPDLRHTSGQLADLKWCGTVFGIYPDCVTFNGKDMLRYSRRYPDLLIYFWVGWDAPLAGIWRVPFAELAKREATYPLHYYLNRTEFRHPDDPYYGVMDIYGNATCSYIIPLEYPLVQVGLTQGRLPL